MIRKFTLLFALVVLLQVSKAQSYIVSPDNSITGTIGSTGTMFMDIDLTNNTASYLHLNWERISNTCPADWFVALCDYQSCFPNVGVGRTMDSIPPGDHGFLKLTIQPNGFLGTGTVVFRVYNSNIPSDEDTLTFDINSIVAVDNYNLASKVAFYPNPVTSNLRIAAVNGELDPGKITVMNLAGSKMMESRTAKTPYSDIDVAALPSGIYLVKFESVEGSVIQKIVKN